MKVIIINTFCKIASIGKIAYGFYEYLVQEGHQCVFLHGGEEHYDDPNLINITSKFEIQCHNKLSYITGMQGKFSNHATDKALRIIRDFNPDMIQLYNLHGDFINYFKLFDGIKDIPTVYSMLDEYAYLGHCCYAFDCMEFQNKCMHCKEELSQYPRSLFRRTGKKTNQLKSNAYKKMKEIVFVGPEWVLERARTSSLLESANMCCVDEYIDTENTFIPRDVSELRHRLDIPDDGVVLLNVAPSNDLRKGVKFYVDAAKRISRKDLYFIHVGYQGNTEGLPNNFKPIGYVADQQELAQYYAMADLFVCTSMADTMPNTCLDALACGTPILGFNVTGVPYVAESPMGEFIDVSLDGLLERLVHVQKKSVQLSEKCRQYAVDRYSRKTYARKMLEVYENLILRNSSSGFN